MCVPQSKFDTLIERLLIVLLAFMPLAFGAVEAWSEAIVVTLAAAISITFFLKLIYERDVRPVWSWAYLPAALFIFVVVFQLIPLKATLIGSLSPSTVAIKKELLSDLPHSLTVLKLMTLSFYSGATRHDLRMVLAVTAVFIVVLNVYRREGQIKRLLGAVAAIGAGVAVLALAQDLFGNGRIYWLVPTASGQAHCGTFICHSHYAQFMNLSIGAAFGLILVKIHEDLRDRRLTTVSEYIRSPEARMVWILVGVIVVGIATVFISLTRGGMISMLIAAGFTTLALCSRRSLKGSGWIVLLAALGAFTCMLYLGFDAVYDRLATLQEEKAYEGRWQIVEDIAVAWTRFPVFGTGLGTHEVVYPMFDRSSIPALATHAENEYAQVAEETGLAGLVTLVGFGLVVWFNYVRSVRRADVPIRVASYGLGFGLLAVMIHSLSDFGQHLPANAMLSAVFCALLIILGRMGRRSNPFRRFTPHCRGSYVLRSIALMCAAGVWAWILLGAHNARVAEGHWKRALAADQEISEKGDQATDDDYIRLISNAAAAAEYEPRNIKYRHWLNFYRWQSISRVTDPNTGAVIIPEQAMQFVYRIVDELHGARLLCPTYGATYSIVGQLERFVLADPNGAELIRKGFELAPCDPTTCFVAGVLDVEVGDIEGSLAKLGRAVRLNGGLFAKVARIYVDHAGRPDLALVIAGQNADWLGQVADILATRDEHHGLAAETRVKVTELLEARCRQIDAPAGTLASLASICRADGNKERAIELYRRALAKEYGQVQWRLTLATLLAQTNRVREAIQEAKTCLRLHPGSKAAQKLIEDLSVLPEVLADTRGGS
jgi:O-antigen ligase/tetratricopeptide (TPR) repeat protein